MQINIHGVKEKVTFKDKLLHAEHQAESMYPAIDGLIDKVDGQLVKYKEKLKS